MESKLEQQEKSELDHPSGRKESPLINFNPEADYSWQANDSFTLKGKELEILHNTLGSIFGSNIPQSQMYLMLNECFKISSDIIKRNVEAGKIKQMELVTGEQENYSN